MNELRVMVITFEAYVLVVYGGLADGEGLGNL